MTLNNKGKKLTKKDCEIVAEFASIAYMGFRNITSAEYAREIEKKRADMEDYKKNRDNLKLELEHPIDYHIPDSIWKLIKSMLKRARRSQSYSEKIQYSSPLNPAEILLYVKWYAKLNDTEAIAIKYAASIIANDTYLTRWADKISAIMRTTELEKNEYHGPINK